MWQMFSDLQKRDIALLINGEEKGQNRCIQIDVVFGNFVLSMFHSMETIQSNPCVSQIRRLRSREG